MNRYYAIQRFDNATGELIPPTMYTIGYCLCARSNNYIVTFTNPDLPQFMLARRQRIVVLRQAFHRIVYVPASDVYAGCIEVLAEQIVDMGFILPEKEVDYDDSRIAVGS